LSALPSAFSKVQPPSVCRLARITAIDFSSSASGTLRAPVRVFVSASASSAHTAAAADVKTSEDSIDARTYYRDLFGDTSTSPGGSEPPVTEFERAALNAQLVIDRLPIPLRASPGFPPGSLGCVAAAAIPFSAWPLSNTCATAWPSWTICPH
jgi:hypothetical protein